MFEEVVEGCCALRGRIDGLGLRLGEWQAREGKREGAVVGCAVAARL